MMQNHYEISSKTLFWTRNIQNSIKSRNLDMSGSEKSWFGHVRTCQVLIWSCPDLKSRDLVMSGPEKSWFGHVRTCPGGQVLTSKQRKYFFWDFTPFHFLWPVLTSKQRKYFFFEILHLSNFYYQFYYFFVKSCVFITKFIIFL